MVYIEIIQDGNNIILNCHKHRKDGEFFRLIIDSITQEIVEKPESADIDATVAYSRVCSLLDEGKSLPKETVAAWG